MFNEKNVARSTKLDPEAVNVLNEDELQGISGGAGNGTVTDTFTFTGTGLKDGKFGDLTLLGFGNIPNDIHFTKTWTHQKEQ